MFEQALSLMSKENLLGEFQKRAEQVLLDADRTGWGFPDTLNDIYSDFYDVEWKSYVLLLSNQDSKTARSWSMTCRNWFAAAKEISKLDLELVARSDNFVPWMKNT